MLSRYIQLALNDTHLEVTEDGRLFLSLPAFPGVWAEASQLEEARAELAEVLEEWIVLSLKRGDILPVLGEVDLNSVGAAA